LEVLRPNERRVSPLEKAPKARANSMIDINHPRREPIGAPLIRGAGRAPRNRLDPDHRAALADGENATTIGSRSRGRRWSRDEEVEMNGFAKRTLTACAAIALTLAWATPGAAQSDPPGGGGGGRGGGGGFQGGGGGHAGGAYQGGGRQGGAYQHGGPGGYQGGGRPTGRYPGGRYPGGRYPGGYGYHGWPGYYGFDYYGWPPYYDYYGYPGYYDYYQDYDYNQPPCPGAWQWDGQRWVWVTNCD
jgi:hypothetical protein